MSLINQCNCCDDCYSQILYECPDELEFVIPDLPDQEVAIYIINIATNRVIVITAESEDGVVIFDLSDVNFANGQTYKAHLRDVAGKVITFDEGEETFNCYQFRYEPVYTN